MSDLQIPAEANEFWFKCGCQRVPHVNALNLCHREGYGEEALPYIVAAELRRLADSWSGWDPEAEDFIARLRRRAGELVRGEV